MIRLIHFETYVWRLPLLLPSNYVVIVLIRSEVCSAERNF